jgi:hypothetical protein
MEAQKTLNRQSHPEQKDQCWMCCSTALQIILKSHNNKNSLVLAQNRHKINRTE